MGLRFVGFATYCQCFPEWGKGFPKWLQRKGRLKGRESIVNLGHGVLLESLLIYREDSLKTITLCLFETIVLKTRRSLGHTHRTGPSPACRPTFVAFPQQHHSIIRYQAQTNLIHCSVRKPIFNVIRPISQRHRRCDRHPRVALVVLRRLVLPGIPKGDGSRRDDFILS